EHGEIQSEAAPEPAEEPVLIQHIGPELPPEPVYEEIEAESESVLIHHVAEPVHVVREGMESYPTKQERKQIRAQKGRRTRAAFMGTLVIQAILVVIILGAIGITAIGTGYAAQYVGNGPVAQFLGGTSVY